MPFWSEERIAEAAQLSQTIMQAYTYLETGKFALVKKTKLMLIEPTDAIIKVALGSLDCVI